MAQQRRKQRRNPLTDVARQAGSKRTEGAEEGEEQAEAPGSNEPGESFGEARKRSPSRQGKRTIVGHYPPDVQKQLRLLAAQQDRTQQGLLAEALNDLFRKYGMEPIAPSDPQE